MTTTAAPLLPASSPPPARPTMLDRWTARLTGDPRLARLWRWLAPAIITLIAGVLRLWNLRSPHAFIFDETYYVKDSWTQWNLGYSSTWPEAANERFLAGETEIFNTIGSFVVHPPLGKWLIGIGMGVFGADSGFGWRIAVALCGTATVLVLYLVAKTLTGSLVFATVASGLMAIDGLAIVMSRVALLDIFLTFFTLIAFWFVLLDRRRHLEPLTAAIAARTVDGEAPAWGPVFWNRPWIVAAGVAVGAATAVKWSGLYVAAGLGVYLVVTDALARRRAGIGFWPTDAAFRQGLVTFVLFIPVAGAVYLSSWIGWLVTDGGYHRQSVPGSALASLWTYHEAMYGFHVGLNSPHGYASPAWQWPLLLRPTSMYFHRDDLGQAGCEIANGCVQNIYSMPNPLIWFAAVAAVVYLVVRFVITRRWQYALVLTGVGVTYVPWLLYPERTIFQFYTIAILPFMLLALTFALRDVAGGGGDTYRRTSGQRTVWVFLGVVVLLSAFWYPVLTAMPVRYDFWRLHNWLPTWI